MLNESDIIFSGYQKLTPEHCSPMFIKDMMTNGVIKYKINITYQLVLGQDKIFHIEGFFRNLKGEPVTVEYTPKDLNLWSIEDFFDTFWIKCKMGYLEEGLSYE